MIKEVNRKDLLGNVRTVEVERDGYVYVGAIRAGVPVKMMSGNLMQPVVATGEGLTLDAAVEATLATFNYR
jgi:hypothetical protein